MEKFEDMINKAIDEWVYFFKHGAIREDFKSPGILLAAKKLDYLMMSVEERRGSQRLSFMHRTKAVVNVSKRWKSSTTAWVY